MKYFKSFAFLLLAITSALTSGQSIDPDMLPGPNQVAEDATPASGEYLLGWASDGSIVKFDIANLPGSTGSVPDGLKSDILVSGGGTVYTVVDQAVDYSELASKPEIPTLISDLTNDSGFITSYTVMESDVTDHESAITILKSQITSFSDADYATAAQGGTADSAIQPGDNISDLTNDSGFITGYAVTEGDVTSALSGAFLTDSGTPSSEDKLLIQDTSDSDNLKYVYVSTIGGGVDWTETQTSSVTDGASNNAFDLQADVDYSLGNVLRVGDAGNASLFALDGAGDIVTSYLDTNSVGNFKISRTTQIIGNLSVVGTSTFGNGFITLSASGGTSNFLSASNNHIAIVPGGTGDVILKANNAATTALLNSQISPSLDESGGNLIFTIKESDGSTHTVTIPYD